MSYNRLTGKWTGNPIVIQLMERYGEMLERAPAYELLIEIEKVVKTSPPSPEEVVWRNEALVVLAHALAD